ncbi:uncharacterized protein LOC110173919 isoform X2 [Boleophthalmus pectinirostris]|uniref:uncharacterized protein LOC110173919 isoform X2 n=1 Tax=Boleophthalmus pectinirostris TaxID=150288 RepID=UPI00242CC65A|nr:uncharacterized protein LOC110173919 isoform X2 [Boleophthalmus pectinirostris]
MGLVLTLGWILVLASVHAQKEPPIKIQSECLGNLFGFAVSPVTGRRLEVAALYNGSRVVLTRSLASQCGFSSNIDASGTVRIYASMLNCFTHSQKDQDFSLELELRLSKDQAYNVSKSCQYRDWASREVLCYRDHMEVSVQRVLPDDDVLPKSSFYESRSGDPRRAVEQPVDPGFLSTTVLFLSSTAEERPLLVSEVLSRGYGFSLTHSRLVLRSPVSTAETYIQQVSGVPMNVLRTSTLFGTKWLVSQIDAAAACPIIQGGVSFSESSIRWSLPWRISPLLSTGQTTLLDLGLGVNGQRLEPADLEARGYSITVGDPYIVVHIPIGAKGGHYKSVVQEGMYLMSYSVEPMLELLWTEDVSTEHTRYKVLFPISTPLLYLPPQVSHDLQENMFKVSIGPFAPDVILLNISFPSESLSLEQSISRGFTVQEQTQEHSSLKTFSVHMPLTDRAVLKKKHLDLTVYSAHVMFGFLVLPELHPFSVSAYLEARVMDTVPPSVSGSCDGQNFLVLVQSGSQHFQMMVGQSPLTSTLAKRYSFVQNDTHFSLMVPILAPDVIYEAIEASWVTARLELVLVSPKDHRRIKDFSLSCRFYATLTECFPNGTITALALKLESVPGLDPGQLTLLDPACGPRYSTARYAYFSFTASSCGTTRKFVSNSMVYENDISLPDQLLAQRDAEDTDYHLKVTCLYDTNTTSALSLLVSPRVSEPFAESATGRLHVHMRMARDESFQKFYTDEDFPLSKTQQEALWFEVELEPALKGRVSLELEKCWATEDQDRTSMPAWKFIINGCVIPDSPLPVKLVPVWKDARVHYPPQLKRFQLLLSPSIIPQASPQLFVHCDVTICDPRNPMDPVCSGHCSGQLQGPRVSAQEHVSTGPIFIS